MCLLQNQCSSIIPSVHTHKMCSIYISCIIIKTFVNSILAFATMILTSMQKMHFLNNVNEKNFTYEKFFLSRITFFVYLPYSTDPNNN